MFVRTKAVVAVVLTVLVLVACTSPTSPATHSDCGGGVATGTGPCP
jgi:hypothetical protein